MSGVVSFFPPFSGHICVISGVFLGNEVGEGERKVQSYPMFCNSSVLFTVHSSSSTISSSWLASASSSYPVPRQLASATAPLTQLSFTTHQPVVIIEGLCRPVGNLQQPMSIIEGLRGPLDNPRNIIESLRGPVGSPRQLVVIITGLCGPVGNLQQPGFIIWGLREPVGNS